MLQKNKINLLPKTSGCYLYKDSLGKIIYVGKAKNIFKRVSSYFSKKDLDPKTSALVKNIFEIDFIITNNELEAFILENSLIKKNNPKYNINLKDSKTYSFLELTSEEFPRLIVARKLKKSPNFFGPFVSGASRDSILQNLIKIFKLRTCKRLPKKECLRFKLGICSAPCINEISRSDYLEDIQGAKKVLQGDISSLISFLRSRMDFFSSKKNFEQAKKTRDQLFALESLKEKQLIQTNKSYNQDIIYYEIKNFKVYLLIFNLDKGILVNKKEFIFDFQEGFFEEFLSKYYSRNSIPRELILQEKVPFSLINYLKYLKKSKIIQTIPLKGDKLELLNLVKLNLESTFFSEIFKLEKLQKVLRLDEFPQRIECIDISHNFGKNTVASCVTFLNGKPEKDSYRKFKIRTVNQIDDFASIAEVVKRRYSRLQKENSPLPNMILIDGGIGQLNSAIKELKNINLNIPIFSLAKKFEEIYVPNNGVPLQLSKKDPARLLLESIRNEAHRFAVTYNRLLQKKSLFLK